MRRLYNMSQPPRTAVVVAPHRVSARGVRLDITDWLPPDGADWELRLCASLGLSPGLDAHAALVQHTAAALVAARLPPVVVMGGGEGAATSADALLSVAILSRASTRLFLARRTPRFEREHLARALVLYHTPTAVTP